MQRFIRNLHELSFQQSTRIGCKSDIVSFPKSGPKFKPWIIKEIVIRTDPCHCNAPNYIFQHHI